MKIRSLQISNILSFQYHADIQQAPKITFENDLNILIGQNGSGKSTVLEIMNLLLKRVFFVQWHINYGIHSNRNEIPDSDKKQVITSLGDSYNYGGFRLEPNWYTATEEQRFRVEIELDDIDKDNIKSIQNHLSSLNTTYIAYASTNGLQPLNNIRDLFSVEIILDKASSTYRIVGDNHDSYNYLANYSLYRDLITLYNAENSQNPIPPLHETFTLIGGYRNYSSYTPSVSLYESSASQQIFAVQSTEHRRSVNDIESSEPSIFNLVRLRIAGKHYELALTALSNEQAEEKSNMEPFIVRINEKLKIINLCVKVALKRQSNWEYSFAFYDIKRNEVITNINSLSAGQKAIIHLIFEAYGRGYLKGGLVIIDEPEIHLHYQFQHAYLQILEELNAEQKCQYILATHSESLINSRTIGKIKRFFTKGVENFTDVKVVAPAEPQKTLIKILDNTRSTYAFFSKTVVLVEGDTDRYFFRAVLDELYPNLSQEIAVLDIGGKGNIRTWKAFFEAYGLEVAYIGDFDNVFTYAFNGQALVTKQQLQTIENILKQDRLDSLSQKRKTDFANTFNALTNDPDFLTAPKLGLWKPLLDMFINFVSVSNTERVNQIRSQFSQVGTTIDGLYADKIFFLKQGSLESYTGLPHGSLDELIPFCANNLSSWLRNTTDEVTEIKYIVSAIVGQPNNATQ